MKRSRYEGRKAPEPDFCFITVDGNKELSEALLEVIEKHFKNVPLSQGFKENFRHDGLFWEIRISDVKEEAF